MGKMSLRNCAIVYDNVNQIQMSEWFSNYWKYKELNNTKFQTNSSCRNIPFAGSTELMVFIFLYA